MYRHMRDEDGQTLVVAVLFFAVLIAFMAVLIDGGTYMWERRNMQGSADAAALAGVRELPKSQSLADLVARDYATTENTDGAKVESVTITDGKTLKINVEKKVSGAFMQMFGVTAPTIGATATARASTVTSLPGMLPFGMLKDQYVTTNPATNTPIGDGGNSKNGVLYPESTANCIAKNEIRNIITGAEEACAMSPDSTIEADVGWKAGIVKGAFGDLLTGNQQSFSDVFEWDPTQGKFIVIAPDSPRIGIIPIVVRQDGGSIWDKKTMVIVGYVLAYIGDTTDIIAPKYEVTGDTSGKTIYVSPVDAVLPADLEASFDEADAIAGSPTVYRLIE